MAIENGRLQGLPFKEARYWYEQGANFHATRWAQTLVFVALRHSTGLSPRQLASSDWGIVLFTFALLFVFSGLKPSAEKWKWGFALSAVMFVADYPMLSWVYHSGGWPGSSLLLLLIGVLLRRARKKESSPSQNLTAVLFLLLITWTYHATMVTGLVMLATVVSYGIMLQSIRKADQLVLRTTQYFGLFVISVLVFSADPLFQTFLTETSLFAPRAAILHFLRTLLGGGSSFRYQVGYSSAGRVALVAPVVALMVAGLVLWMRNQLRNNARLSGTELVAGSLFLASPGLAILSVAAGEFRFAEAGFLVTVATPLLWTLSFERAPTRHARVLLGTLATLLVLITMLSLTIVARDPITRYAFVRASDERIASWAAQRVHKPFFADMFLSALILDSNSRADVISLEGVQQTLEELGDVIYSGEDAFVRELARRGAKLAVINFRNIDARDQHDLRHAILTANFFMSPLPDYAFKGPFLGGIVYASGENRVLLLSGPGGGDESSTTGP